LDKSKKYLDSLVSTIYGEQMSAESFNLSYCLPDVKESYSPLLQWPSNENIGKQEALNQIESVKMKSKKILRFKK